MTAVITISDDNVCRSAGYKVLEVVLDYSHEPLTGLISRPRDMRGYRQILRPIQYTVGLHRLLCQHIDCRAREPL